jgi:hypothetical protein
MARQSIISTFTLLLTMVQCLTIWGQHPLTDQVVAQYEIDTNPMKALEQMHKVILLEKQEAYAQFTLGYLLKECFKIQPQSDTKEHYRENALLAFEESLRMNASNDPSLIDNIDKAQKFIVSTLYNDALLKAKQFQMGNEISADAAYDYFESWNKKSITPQSSRALRIEFDKKKAERFYEFWETDAQQIQWLNQCVLLYEKILKEDPTDCEAMNNTAIIYYNIGVFKIKQIDANVEFEALMKIQEDALALFHQALPYAQATFADCPKSATQYKALMFIYRAIGNDERFLQLQQEYKNQYPED